MFLYVHHVDNTMISTMFLYVHHVELADQHPASGSLFLSLYCAYILSYFVCVNGCEIINIYCIYLIAYCFCMFRFTKFLLFLGYSPETSLDLHPGSFCKLLSEFALEYRTTREKVIVQEEKRATRRERTKTRGVMIVEVRTRASILGGKVPPVERRHPPDSVSFFYVFLCFLMQIWASCMCSPPPNICLYPPTFKFLVITLLYIYREVGGGTWILI